MTAANDVERASPACFATERDLNSNPAPASDVKDLRIVIIGAGTLT